MQPGLGEIALLFLKLGTIGFGGPAAHIALMESEVVRLALMAVVTWQLMRSAVVDGPTALLALVGCLGIFVFRLNSAWLVAGAAVGTSHKLLKIPVTGLTSIKLQGQPYTLLRNPPLSL